METNREEMIIKNQNLVWTVIHKKFPGIKMDKEDLFQQGQIALIRAVDTYQPSKGSFSTVACTAIYRELKRYIISQKGGIRIPEYLNSYMVKVAKTVQKMENDDIVVTPESLAKEMLINLDEARKALDNYRSASELISLDATDGDNDPLLDIISSEDPYKEVINGDNSEYLQSVLKEVYGNRDGQIIWDYFNEKDITLEELGKKFGITKERVRQIVEKVNCNSGKTDVKLKLLRRKLQENYE